jgi:hypothetical protein
MNFGRHSDYLGGRVFTDLQRPPSHPTEDRPDDIFFGDPTRRWRFCGQSQDARPWRHSFDYLDDAEDPGSPTTLPASSSTSRPLNHCNWVAALQTLPRDAELLAFEAGCEDYCEREVDDYLAC